MVSSAGEAGGKGIGWQWAQGKESKSGGAGVKGTGHQGIKKSPREGRFDPLSRVQGISGQGWHGEEWKKPRATFKTCHPRQKNRVTNCVDYVSFLWKIFTFPVLPINGNKKRTKPQKEKMPVRIEICMPEGCFLLSAFVLFLKQVSNHCNR